MDTTIIETREKGISNYDYFSVDTADDAFTLNGRTFPLGQIALDVLSLPRDYVTELLKLGARLYDAFRELATSGKRTAEQYRAVREAILGIIDAISDRPPFSYFDSAYSRAVVEDVYAEEKIARYAELLPASLPREVEAFAIVYIYLCNDLATFGTLMLNFVEYIVANDSRQPKALATTALFYFTHPEINRLLKESNPCPFVEGVNLRPRATVAPVIPYNRDDPDNIVIKKRVYYGRIMDFFVADLFDGLSHGHYVWKCGYCGRYYLMTTAHRQLYCQTVAPGQKYPCSSLAKHHRTATEQTKRNKQSAEANPLHLLWKKRDASIRKDKSRGKYPAELCERAKIYAKNCYERALSDAAYADAQYNEDMILENIYRNA